VDPKEAENLQLRKELVKVCTDCNCCLKYLRKNIGGCCMLNESFCHASS
jgi:hypothetical protein